MRILFLSHEAIYSGAPLALMSIIKSLKNKVPGLEATVMFLNDGPLKKEFETVCQTVVCVSKEPRWNRLLRMIRVRHDWNPNFLKQSGFSDYDLVYANSVASLKVALYLKKKYGFPVLAHFHESEFCVASRHIHKDMVDLCDYYVAVSELCKKNLIENFKVQVYKITLQHPFSPWINKWLIEQHGVNPVQIEGLADDDFVIGFSGTTDWVKGDDLVPLIAENFFKHYPDAKCKFLVVGLFNESITRMTYVLKRMNLLDKIMMLRRVSQPLEYYSRFDVFVVPSREDSFPLAVEENALLKKPIVLFKDATGASEWLDSTSSIQVPYLDIEGITEAIYKLYSDRALCNIIGENAFNKVLFLYKEDSDNKAIVDLINKIERKQ